MGYPSMGSNRTATGIEPPEPPALKLGDRDEDEMADAVLVKEVRRDAAGVGGFLRDAVRETGRFPSHAARIGAGLSPLPHFAASSRPSALGLSIDAPRNAR